MKSVFSLTWNFFILNIFFDLTFVLHGPLLRSFFEISFTISFIFTYPGTGIIRIDSRLLSVNFVQVLKNTRKQLEILCLFFFSINEDNRFYVICPEMFDLNHKLCDRLLQNNLTVSSSLQAQKHSLMESSSWYPFSLLNI